MSRKLECHYCSVSYLFLSHAKRNVILLKTSYIEFAMAGNYSTVCIVQMCSHWAPGPSLTVNLSCHGNRRANNTVVTAEWMIVTGRILYPYFYTSRMQMSPHKYVLF